MQPQAEPLTAHAAGRPGLFRNTAVNVLGLFLANGLSALGGLVTARVLGAAGVGVLAVIFGLADFGRSVTNFTHVPSIIQAHKGVPPEQAYGTSLMLKLTSSAAFVVVLVILSPVLAALFRVPSWAIALASIGIVVGVFYEVGTARLEAENRMVLRNILLGLGPAAGFLLVVALALLDLLSVYTSILTTLAANIVMSLGFIGLVYHPLRMRFRPDVARYYVSYGLRIVATGLLGMGLLWTDTLMVSALAGNAATGIYNVAFQLTFVMVTASTAVGVALTPALSELAGRGQDTTTGYQRGTLLALGMSLAILLAYLAGGRLILGIYGGEFLAGYPALLVLTLFGLSAALAVPVTTLLTVTGHASWLVAISLAQLALNIPLNYVLITRMGITGAAVATASVFVLGTLAAWILARKATGAWPLSRAVLQDALLALRRRPA